MKELEEIAGTVAQTFLGLTVNCARCHDHKFDPISTREYYGFIAALDGVLHGEKQIDIHQNRKSPREDLELQRKLLLNRLVEPGDLPAVESFPQTANQLRSKKSIAANEKGKTYRVSDEDRTVGLGVGGTSNRPSATESPCAF